VSPVSVPDVKWWGLSLTLLVVAFTVAVLKRESPPQIIDDPQFRSGRPSVCTSPPDEGDLRPVATTDTGVRPRDAGGERSLVHTFDAAGLSGGTIIACSEYGPITVVGVDGPGGRIVMHVASPVPGGVHAVEDTRVRTNISDRDGRLRLVVSQITQGIAAFRSLVANGARPATVDLRIEVPRNGPYDLHLVAHHRRVRVQGLDVRGTIEGRRSPGSDIDARLAGTLTVRAEGVGYGGPLRDDAAELRGTTARLFTALPGMIDIQVERGDVNLTLVGLDAGLDVTTKGWTGEPVDIGSAEAWRVEEDGAYARSSGFERAHTKVYVRASSAAGIVSVRRAAR
jgi:hypothetical protein